MMRWSLVPMKVQTQSRLGSRMCQGKIRCKSHVTRVHTLQKSRRIWGVTERSAALTEFLNRLETACLRGVEFCDLPTVAGI